MKPRTIEMRLPGINAWWESFSPSINRFAFISDQLMIRTDEMPNKAIQIAPKPYLHWSTKAAIAHDTRIVLGVP